MAPWPLIMLHDQTANDISARRRAHQCNVVRRNAKLNWLTK
jgi:hypothetical protein